MLRVSSAFLKNKAGVDKRQIEHSRYSTERASDRTPMTHPTGRDVTTVKSLLVIRLSDFAPLSDRQHT